MHPPESAAPARRCAVVDLGSNSVRLVVFEGARRNPVAIFNEKAVLRLGRGLQTTGRLNEAGVAQALKVMVRYHAIARAMRADPFEVLATAAVRDASNGAEFVAALERACPARTIRILSGHEEAAFSAAGVLCGIPDADGILADIGGGSLELVRLDPPARADAATLPPRRHPPGRTRRRRPRPRPRHRRSRPRRPPLARRGRRPRPLPRRRRLARPRPHPHAADRLPAGHRPPIHHRPQDAPATSPQSSVSAPRALERLPGAPRRRVEDLPYAAIVLRRLLRATGARRVVFSANGIREGWFMQHPSPSVRSPRPAARRRPRGRRQRLSRDATPARPPSSPGPRRSSPTSRPKPPACAKPPAGCPTSAATTTPNTAPNRPSSASSAPPGALDHPTRAFLALTMAIRYEAEPDAPFLATARALLDPAAIARAELLGVALRLAYTLSAGTPTSSPAPPSRWPPAASILRLEGAGVFAGEGVQRRLDRVAAALNVTPEVE